MQFFAALPERKEGVAKFPAAQSSQDAPLFGRHGNQPGSARCPAEPTRALTTGTIQAPPLLSKITVKIQSSGGHPGKPVRENGSERTRTFAAWIPPHKKRERGTGHYCDCFIAITRRWKLLPLWLCFCRCF